MIFEDLLHVESPRITVVTPSLNHARFLRQTIETVATQSYRSFEHLVIDGMSSDGTTDILKEYPHVCWICEPDESSTEAFEKGLAMTRGEYIIHCAVSDGFLDRNWFRKCVEVLEKDDEVSLVWGFPQYMSEDGDLLNVSYQDFFSDPPPQKEDFLAFWLATGFVLPEGNYCVRSAVLKRHFPDRRAPRHFQVHSLLGFMYNFMTHGFCPHFIPVVANFGRTHAGQQGQRLAHIEGPAARIYFRQVKKYRNQVLNGEVTHRFRTGRSEVFKEIGRRDLGRLRRQIWRHAILRSRVLRRDPYTLALRALQWLRARSGR
jgi:glycosyltransferase involved in cell wall biosynthesis